MDLKNLLLELKDNNISKSTRDVIKRIPRQLFMLDKYIKYAYVNAPFEIDNKEIIFQPLLSAFIMDRLKLKRSDKLLEIGTGSGYDTSLYASKCPVTTLEIDEVTHSLTMKRMRKLEDLSLFNINFINANCHTHIFDSSFNKIVIGASVTKIPKNLLKLLMINGRMIVPIINKEQGTHLFIVTRLKDGKYKMRKLLPVNIKGLRFN